ncbi:MAG TPA: YggS family pyridoxal phosphate-dependent enzyme [Pyrinomonadaceae bacterium]|nr:YggS family pyridoxal phosphate-dependent enzyme [Pyrinomonadaceae bacterium]
MTKVDPTETLAARFAGVKARISAAAQRCGRDPREVTLIAISKTHPADVVKRLVELGAADLGENRVQEAEEKIPQVGRSVVRWHLVGHLQANKARRALGLFDVIHSLDSIDLARRLDRLCAEIGREPLPLLIQVDLGHEETKSGVDEKELPQVVETVQQLEHLELIGLMTLPPFFEDPKQARPYFRRLRELRDDLAGKGAFGERRGELSMGMTNDFVVAIEEGATMVRVGTAIFGERGHKEAQEAQERRHAGN